VTSVLVRHAAAGDREHWDGDDFHRPLNARGRRESEALVELLRPLGIRRVVSSPYVRCFQTVEPLSAALGLPLEIDDRLGEGEGQAALALIREDGVVSCTHGDVVHDLVGYGLKKAAALVLRDGQVVRALPPPKL
jgi:phosphohistidine phosphatase SixA